MQYIGVDIVEIDRIKGAIARWGEPFLKRVYTSRELERYRQKPSSLAARFAGKEAVIKALRPTGSISLNQIEVLSDRNSRPQVNLYGKAREKAAGLGLSGFSISLSHSREYAIAFVTGDPDKGMLSPET